MTNTNTAAARAAARAAAHNLTVGGLAVATDYKGRKVGIRVRMIHDDGTISGTVAGLDAPAPYKIGDVFARDVAHVRGAE